MKNKEKEIKERIAKIKGLAFKYDGCHKIYILETNEDIKDVIEKNEMNSYYTILPMKELANVYLHSCPLRFIMNNKLTKTFIRQGEYDDIN